MMKLLMQTLLLAWWSSSTQAQGDTFAAVPGTGWTDYTQLQSTCSTPGYFQNEADCTRFYVCADLSTPEKRLLLRYDFDCPAGTAFDQSTKNCNHPGPDGCVSSGSGSGWGWSNQQHGSGLWQSTATVSKIPSWGTPTKNPVSTTIIRQPVSSWSGGSVIRVSSTTPAPLPSNPRYNVPSTNVVQFPGSSWESLRLRPSHPVVFENTRITGASRGGGGWSASRVVSNPGVFQSARITHQHNELQNPNVVQWGTTTKILPVDSVGVFKTERVTPVPPAEWEAPQPFPVAPQTTRVRIVQQNGNGWSNQGTPAPTPAPAPTPPPQPAQPGSGWSSHLHFSPSPSPQPANPTILRPAPIKISASPSPQTISWHSSSSHGQQPAQVQVQHGPWQASTGFAQVPQPHNPVTWESARITQIPSANWESAKITQVQQQQAPVSWNAPQAANPSLNFIQGNAGVEQSSLNLIQGNTQAANPSYNLVRGSSIAVQGNLPAGFENFKFTPLPSGYIWQSSPNGETSQSDSGTFVSSTPATLVSSPPQANSIAATSSARGDYGIVQQGINEDQNQGTISGGGKSHIQLVYESREKQLQEQQQQQQGQNLPPQELTSKDSLGNANVYEFTAPPESGLKGRIIVLYAPLNTKGGKREAPVIEVEVEEDDEGNDGEAKK